METKLKVIGKLEGQPVHEVELTSSTGVRISIISYGAIVRDWKVPVNKSFRSVVLGFPYFEAYLKDEAHLGAIIGRVANRIGGACFKLAGKTYNLPANVGNDLLHGGPQGLSRRNWKFQKTSPDQAVLTYKSPSGEMGFPGDVEFTTTYTLTGFSLRIEMSAVVSETTPINMVQHQYFNLAGSGTILDHQVVIQGDRYTPLSPRLIPTGEIKPVDGTLFDFRNGRTFRDDDNQARPYDVNFGLAVSDRKSQPVATVLAPDRSLTLKLWTDQPGLQLYTSEYLQSEDVGLQGEKYTQFSGLCLEDQMFPDALNHPHFPSILVSPDKPYTHWCEIEIR